MSKSSWFCPWLPHKTSYDIIKVKLAKERLRFGKVTLANLKIGTLSVTLATSNFQELFVMKFDSNSS